MATLRFDASAHERKISSLRRARVGLRVTLSALASVVVVILTTHSTSRTRTRSERGRGAPPAPTSALMTSIAIVARAMSWDDETGFTQRELARERAEETCAYCEALANVVSGEASGRGLELASGSGAFAREMRRRGVDVIGVDPRLRTSVGVAGDALARGDDVAAELAELPFATAHFDFVVALEPFAKLGVEQRAKNVDPVINEATRVVKIGGTMIFAARATLNGREEPDATAGGDDRAGSKTRRWWIDTFCAHGWVPDDDKYMALVKTARVDVDKTPRTSTPRSWFVLRRVSKMQECACVTPEGRDEDNFCGRIGRPNARNEVRAFWSTLKSRRYVAKPR